MGGGERCGGLQGDPLPVLLVVGVSSGFSVWTIPVSPPSLSPICLSLANSVCEWVGECVSEWVCCLSAGGR